MQIEKQEPRYLFGWRRAPLTVRECWRNVVFFGLVVLFLVADAMQDFWHGSKSFPHWYFLLIALMYLGYAQAAWQNLRLRQQGETVYGLHIPRREGWGIVLGIGTVVLVAITCGAVAKWVDFPHSGLLWPDLAMLLPAWTVLIFGWLHLPAPERS